MFNTLRNELKISISNKVIELLGDSGSRFEELFLRTKVQKFFKKYFKSLEFPIYLNDETDISKSLCDKLMYLINLLTSKNYTGRTKYLIVSPQIGTLLSDNINFIRVENNSNFNISVPEYIGYLIDVKVFVNRYFTDNKVIIGSVSDDSPNINIVEYLDSFDCIEMMDSPSYSMVRKYKLDKICGIASVGNIENHVASININLNKKPLWRRLLCL